MRPLVVSLFLAASVLVGCLAAPEVDPVPPRLPLAVEDIVVPDGAALVPHALGMALEWLDVSLPFESRIVIVAGATIVRIEAEVDATLPVSTTMRNAETDRRRCNADVLVSAWNVPYRGTHACSGVTAIDPPGSEWIVRATGPATAKTVRVVYIDAPLDGPVADLDLSLLSMPIHDLLPTTWEDVPSFDGVPLRVEVTLPEGEGPWPTVIASSPYNGQTNRLGQANGIPAMWAYFTHDWAKRGYAVVNADVRGFGLSGGCVEVWGENEQRDQAFLVDWVASQAWSDGRVGFYGQSYVGTTPVAAAVQAPDALKAIIAVAPVISAYEDWHYGGVPNGENTLSPVAYQVLTDMPGQGTTPLEILQYSVKGLCDPTLIARANDPRAIYDAFYVERDFKLRADRVKAATLYTQGFEDTNVKSSMIPGWFNEITAPKLGVFGHWVHQHPTRADEEILFLGWMDEYVKGIPLGFSAFPQVLVRTNLDTERQTDAWPTPDLPETLLWPDWSNGALGTEQDAARGADLALAPVSSTAPNILRVHHEFTEDLAVSGTLHLHLRGTLMPGGNAFLAARIYDVQEGRQDLVTYGMYHLAHDETHTTWTPVTGPSDVRLPFLPTEYVFRAGHELVVELYGVSADPFAFPGFGLPLGQFRIGAHPDGVGALILPTVPMEEYTPIGHTGQP